MSIVWSYFTGVDIHSRKKKPPKNERETVKRYWLQTVTIYYSFSNKVSIKCTLQCLYEEWGMMDGDQLLINIYERNNLSWQNTINPKSV